MLQATTMSLLRKLRVYYLTAIAGLLFSLLGFSYNAWRLESSEANSNVRTAAFELFKALAELEQVVYAAHYDHDPVEGSPRRGWVRVGLVVDLSPLVSGPVQLDAVELKNAWQQDWPHLSKDAAAAERLTAKIDKLRASLRTELQRLD